ncbi:hypothetical protein JYU34_021460 [Plutella xylostella]|uniref:RRM domain-containing protein n=1 Tax=Plutella xylostella TaxID=51655 RepID=A0ABQ7PTM5_PLUXY|nr:hypothetical protein JYU34_021460 [Plutella xylostella]
MAGEYALVSELEHEEPLELPLEADGALLLSTVRAQFPAASGLKYRAPGGRLRGLRLVDGRLAPPPAGWPSARYHCAAPPPSPPPPPPPRPQDLVVLGLPWRTGEDAVRDYFASFGELEMVQVKRDPRTGLSKGFGFIKFTSWEAQARALARRHLVDGRWCDVRVPGRGGGAAPRKVFVGRCTEALTAEDLRDYFTAFGQVTDVFVPKPFRAFGFVTFMDAEVAQSLCGQDHIIKGVSVNIASASPKREKAAAAPGWAPYWPPGAGPDQKPYLKYE